MNNNGTFEKTSDLEEDQDKLDPKAEEKVPPISKMNRWGKQPYDSRVPLSKRIKNKLRDYACTALVAAIPLTALYVGTIGTQYMDLPGISKCQNGRTKNGIAAVVAGIVGQRLYGTSDINLQIQKFWFPDAEVKGNTTEETINTMVDLMLTSSEFQAYKDQHGKLQGTVHKSEFNWDLEQISAGTYKVKRFGLKRNATLNLGVADGKITGLYERKGEFDWDINGTYDEHGNVTIEIDGTLSLGITLEGKITRR